MRPQRQVLGLEFGMAAVAGISLYQYSGCGYCSLVRREVERLGVDLEVRDIHRDPERLRELVEATGRATVPCLRLVSGSEVTWMHESYDIIAYLRDRFGAQE